MKGVSDKDAQNNVKIKGKKTDLRKPLQVLHINKKDNNPSKEEFFDDNQDQAKELKTETKEIKPHLTEAKTNEKKKNGRDEKQPKERRSYSNHWWNPWQGC